MTVRALLSGAGLALILMSAGPARARAADIVVGGGERASLAAAVAEAAPGDRILVRSGRYHEAGLVIDRPLTIDGEPGAVIVARDGEQILTVTADDVTIRGLTFSGVSTSFVDDRSAIRIERAARCRIANNVFEDAFFGIYLSRASECTIEDNVLAASKEGQTKSGNGIHLWNAHDVEIRGNRITGHRDGIYLEFSSRVHVADNEAIENLRYGLHFMFSDSCGYARNSFERNEAGVAVMYSRHVTITGNRFVDNWGASAFGLLLKDITDSSIAGNHFERNTVAIYAEGANRVVVEHNEFRGNGKAIKLMANSLDSVFRNNNFVANTFDVTTNSRQSFSTFTQNYWDAYRGYDLDRDGTGDVPFYPVRLFALLVETHEAASILLRSLFVDVLEAAERVLPTLTPKALHDEAPRMKPAEHTLADAFVYIDPSS